MKENTKLYLLEISSDSLEQYNVFLDLLSSSRKRRVKNYIRKIDKKLSICSELLIKLALNEVSKKNFDEIYLYHNKQGAVSCNINNVSISLSHTNSIVVVAISTEKIGVDVEKVDRFNGMKYLDMGCFLSESEKRYLIKESSCESLSLIWTRKEAFGKYNNKGLIQDLSIVDTLSCENELFNTLSYKEYTISICSKFSRDCEIISITEKDLLEFYTLII